MAPQRYHVSTLVEVRIYRRKTKTENIIFNHSRKRNINKNIFLLAAFSIQGLIIVSQQEEEIFKQNLIIFNIDISSSIIYLKICNTPQAPVILSPKQNTDISLLKESIK